MTYEIKQTIAPKGYLRVGINMSNFLLVVGKNENGDPIGISPDIAKLIAKKQPMFIVYNYLPSASVPAFTVACWLACCQLSQLTQDKGLDC